MKLVFVNLLGIKEMVCRHLNKWLELVPEITKEYCVFVDLMGVIELQQIIVKSLHLAISFQMQNAHSSRRYEQLGKVLDKQLA